MTRATSARRLGAAIAVLFVTTACGQSSQVANPPPPALADATAQAGEPAGTHKRPHRTNTKNPFVPPASKPAPVAAAPQPAPSPTPPPPPRPPRKKDDGHWHYPPLSLAIGYIDGHIYVGAQASANDGCHSLIGSSRGRHIRIKGVYATYGNYGCTMAVETEWHAVPVDEGPSSVTVAYLGNRGRYKIRVSRDGVETRFQSGDNVAPPVSETWWWIPDDILFAHVWYGKPDEVKRVSDRVHERLMDEGASVFEAPDGYPIPTGSSPDYPPYGEDPRDYRDDLNARSRERVYLSGLSWDELRDIANEEAQTERCTFVRFSREPYRDGVIGRPPCDRD